MKKPDINQEVLGSLDAVNQHLEQIGMLRLKLVDPNNLKGQRVNARYMKAETMQQLVENVKKDKRLESVPLIYEDGEQDRIISGHHRVEAAKSAKIPYILCMVAKPEDRDEVVSKQLSHNALVGQDDQQVLTELFNSIQSIEKRIATGLQDAIAKISYTSLNYRLGNWKELVLLLLPEDIGLFDEAMDEIMKQMQCSADAEIRLGSMEAFDKFAKAMMKVKRAENIKSNGTALMRLVELAQERMSEQQIQHNGSETGA
jgi:hypothetical protein